MSGVERDHLAREQAWERSALCAEVDPELFFADANQHAATKAARRICETCVVRPECLDDALTRVPEYGVRAGYTPRELYELRLSSGRTKDAEVREKYEQARTLRDEGKPLTEIARRLGYAGHAGHAGVRYLLELFEAEAS